MTPARIVRTYLVITGLFNFAASLIWGVDTLFKLHAGLDIFQVMLTNAAFTAGMVVFEIPTGVVADTLGRRVSLMLCVATLLVATLLYVATAWFHWGFWPFMVTSVLLGLGYTFYTGAVDAWLVDALKATGFTEPMEAVFAKGQMIFGAAMLAGTLSGGLLGQIDLAVPYVVRAATFLPLLLLAWLGMTEIGYTPRALEWRRVPAELRRVFVEGLHFGLHHRVVRPVMFASLVNMSFMIFGFYSWQRYFLDLLGRDLVWVSGLIAALLSVSMILGNALMRPLSRVIRTPNRPARDVHGRPGRRRRRLRGHRPVRAGRSRPVLRRRGVVSGVRRRARNDGPREAGVLERPYPIRPAGHDHLARRAVRRCGRRGGPIGVGVPRESEVDRRGVDVLRPNSCTRSSVVLDSASQRPPVGQFSDSRVDTQTRSGL